MSHVPGDHRLEPNQRLGADVGGRVLFAFISPRSRTAQAGRWANGGHSNRGQLTSLARLVLLLVLSTLMQGCIGAGVAWSKTETFQGPDLKTLQKRLAYSGAETNLTVSMPAWWETNRGKPDSIRRDGKSPTTEVWTYRNDLNLNGGLLFLLIPIPLEVPVGREWTKLTIQDGRVICVKRRFTRMAGGIVGYSVGPCGITDFGTYSLGD